jgi:Uma2 family endonuclease
VTPGLRVSLVGLAPRDLLLAVEVESPSTRRRDRTLKSEVYREWGVRHVWLVDPVEQVVRRSGQAEPEELGLTPDEVFGEQRSAQ